MKKLLLASAVAALSVSAANAAPTIYGKVFVGADYIDSELEANVTVTDQFNNSKNVKVDFNNDEFEFNSHSSRIGFKGSEALTADTDVVYQLEYNIDAAASRDNTFKSRDTYLGLKNKSFGEVRVGRNTTTADYVNNVTVTEGFWDNLGTNTLSNDAFEEYEEEGIETVRDLEKALSSKSLADALNMVDSGRTDSSLIWFAPQLDGVPLQFSAMYGSEQKGEDGWGAALTFDQGNGFTAGVGYDSDLSFAGDLIRGTVTADLGKLNTGLPLTLGALYQEADFDGGDKKEKGYVISAEMGLTNFAKPASIYAQYNNTSNLAGVDGLDSDQIVVGGKYYYKPNVIAHAYIGQNKADFAYGIKDVYVVENNNSYNIDSKNDIKLFAVGAGLEYKF